MDKIDKIIEKIRQYLRGELATSVTVRYFDELVEKINELREQK